MLAKAITLSCLALALGAEETCTVGKPAGEAEDDSMSAVQLRRERRQQRRETAVEWYDPLDPAYIADLERELTLLERSSAQPTGLLSRASKVAAAHVKCTYSDTMCAGNQCCPRAPETGGKTYPCPSADAGWNGCENAHEKVPDNGPNGPGQAANAQLPPQQDGIFQMRSQWNSPDMSAMNSPPLRAPMEQRAVNGMLDATIELTWGWVELPGMGIRVRTRLYNGTYPGPTLRVQRGDHVRVKVVNSLGPDDPKSTYFQRREGQAAQQYPHGLPKDEWFYQNVGQSDTNPSMMMGHENNFHTPNTTNLHVHGWHVSPHLGQDEVLETKIPPGKSFTYNYELSSYHAAGNSWYHGHLHGTTMLQTAGGMLGALIIDDSPGEAPEWITKLPETLLVIHEANWGYFGPAFLKYAPQDMELQGCFPFESFYTARCGVAIRAGMVANVSGDRLWKMEYAKGFGYRLNETNPISSAFTVNGQYMPTMKLTTGEWMRTRFVFGGDNFPLNIIFNQTADGREAPCEMRLIAKDSNWLPRYPRKLSRGVFLGAGSRCQVIMRCWEEGTFVLRNNMQPQSNTDLDMHQTMLFVQVQGTPKRLGEPEEYVFSPPRYLNSLLNVPISQLYRPHVSPSKNFENNQTLETTVPDLQADGVTMTTNLQMVRIFGVPTRDDIPPAAFEMQPVRYTVQNKTFSGTHPFAHFPVAEILQIEMMGIDGHPWHMHVNPAEVYSYGFSDINDRYGGFFMVGDFQDVFQLPIADWPDILANPGGGANYTAVARFQTDCYTGQLVLHCHVLYHEDLGMMTYFNMTGTDHSYSKMFENRGIFKDPPQQCMKPGQKCAPAYCTNYQYASA